ncbi:MAG: hypothetical protein ABI867_36800 [Kofleriaceae bacterium]
MRRNLKLLFALALAGLTVSGLFSWRALFTEHQPLINTTTCIYAAFLVLALGSVIALRRQPPVTSLLR